MKETRGTRLLKQVKKAQASQKDKRFDKIVGKKKNTAKFDKVNFNG